MPKEFSGGFFAPHEPFVLEKPLCPPRKPQPSNLQPLAQTYLKEAQDKQLQAQLKRLGRGVRVGQLKLFISWGSYNSSENCPCAFYASVPQPQFPRPKLQTPNTKPGSLYIFGTCIYGVYHGVYQKLCTYSFVFVSGESASHSL